MPNLHHPQDDFTGTVTLGGNAVHFNAGRGFTEAGVAHFARNGFTVSPTIETDDGDVLDLDALTVPELRDLAATDGVDLTGVSLKADIVTAIAAHGDDN